MRILAAIANYGTGNDQYLVKVLEGLRAMRHHVHIVVTTNIPKNFGPGIEVAVGLPEKDPRSLAFAHRRIFVERAESYDLFIYTEDDNPITQRNVDAFLRVTSILPEDDIAGFLRVELDKEQKAYFPEVHKHYHWDPASLYSKADHTFAFFTDEHAGCYVLTANQLRRAIASRGFMVPLHQGKYGPLEAAATDPYTQCGFRKMICISHFEDFLLPHLSNKSAGKGIAVSADDLYVQLKALASLAHDRNSKSTLFPSETKLFLGHWSKSYYEPCQHELLSLVPDRAQNILSVGCGWGVTENHLVRKGLRVRAIAMDAVIAASAEARGVAAIHGEANEVLQRLAHERFDCILLSNVLHLVPNPPEFLAPFVKLLAPDGSIVASVPNLSSLRRLSRWIRFKGQLANPTGYNASRMHITNGQVLCRWLRQVGLEPNRIVYEIADDKERFDRMSLHMMRPILGSSVYVSGLRTDWQKIPSLEREHPRIQQVKEVMHESLTRP